jgi:hypothetical protein
MTMNGINRYLMLFCIGLMLTACEESSDPINLFPLPKQLQQRLLPDGVVLKAVARILDLGMEIEMDIKNDQATGFFSNLPAGTYTVEVTFSDAASGVVLATAKRPVEIGHSAGEVAFGKDDYVYPDDDSDRYSNLDEIRFSRNPADPDDFPIPRRVFITSDSGPADLSQWPDAGGKTGVLAGDAICQTRANEAGVEGTFRAWLSDDSNDAYCHVMGLGGKKGSCVSSASTTSAYVRTDNFLVARSLDDLIKSGEMYSAIQFDERGTDLIGSNPKGPNLSVWTGTNALGKVGGSSSSGGHCNNWTSTSVDDRGSYGYGQKTANGWTAAWDAPCGGEYSRARLYCFQETPVDDDLVDHDVEPLYKTAPAKKVFVTSETGTGDLSSWPDSDGRSGIDAGNAICQNLARKAEYANADKFTAWLSSSTADAIDSLLQSSGPWVRPDGVLIAKDRTDLIDGSIFTSISQAERENKKKKEEYITSASSVWTGTQSTGRNSQDAQGQPLNCDDWSSSASSAQGKYGNADDTSYGWTANANNNGTLSCDVQGRLYCFEND